MSNSSNKPFTDFTMNFLFHATRRKVCLTNTWNENICKFNNCSMDTNLSNNHGIMFSLTHTYVDHSVKIKGAMQESVQVLG